MNQPCEQTENITKLQTENAMMLPMLSSIKKTLVGFWVTFAIAMIGLSASVVVASFNMGGYVKDVAVLQEKVAWLEEQALRKKGL